MEYTIAYDMTVPEDTLATAETAGVALDAAIAAIGPQTHVSTILFANAVAARYPDSLPLQHRSGLALRLCADYQAALDCYRRALLLHPRFHFTELEMAQSYIEMGDADQARSWFDQAMRSAPHYAPGYALAARFERQQQRHLAALLYMRSAHVLDPGNTAVLSELVDLLLFHGHVVQAQEVLIRALQRGELEPSKMQALLDLLAQTGAWDALLRYAELMQAEPGSSLAILKAMHCAHANLARTFDLNSTVMRAAARERSARWMPVPELIGQLRDAIRRREPYSLVRLGDGEARFLLFVDPTNPGRLNEAQRRAIVDVIWYNWFGSAFTQAQRDGLPQLREMVLSAIASADAIGVPDSARLAVDHVHEGYLGYLEQFIAGVFAANPAVRATDAFAHLGLHEASPFLYDLLHGKDWLGVISPHAELGPRLRRHLGIGAGVDYLLPGEMRLPDDAGIARGQGHFPELFDAVMRDLEVPRPGAVVLVAGGLLGKVYCARVRELGGIAIDIGSIADAWMGYNTRPGHFQPRERWALPD